MQDKNTPIHIQRRPFRVLKGISSVSAHRSQCRVLNEFARRRGARGYGAFERLRVTKEKRL